MNSWMLLRSATSDIASRTAWSLNAKCLLLALRAFAFDLGPRVGGVELDELDVAARDHVHLALAAVLHALEHLVFDLQVPGAVVLAGLQHRACAPTWRRRRPSSRSSRSTAGSARGSSVLASPRTMSPGLKSTNLYGPVPTGFRLVGRIARLVADVGLEQVLRDDHAVGADERGRPRTAWASRKVTRTVCESIFVDLDVLVDPAGHRRGGRDPWRTPR